MNLIVICAPSGGVSYKQVGADYFEKRGLERYAKVWSLWASRRRRGDLGSLLGLELRPRQRLRLDAGRAVHHRGHVLGPHLQPRGDVARAAAHRRARIRSRAARMGPWGGIFTGLAESIEYILTPAVIVFFIGSYMSRDLRDAGPNTSRSGGSASYVVFLLLNLLGVELSFRVSVIVTLRRARRAGRVLGQRDSVTSTSIAGR